jgi:hypothetical protein
MKSISRGLQTDPSAPNPEQADNGEDAEAPDTISGVDKEFLAFQERLVFFSPFVNVCRS